MFGFQAEGSAPIVRGEIVRDPDTIASAIRIGNPASWELALTARDETDGYFGAISDAKILDAHRILSSEVGIFVEPASAASAAGLRARGEAGGLPRGVRVGLTGAGKDRKDPTWALRAADGTGVAPTSVDVDVAEVAEVLGLRAQASATASA